MEELKIKSTTSQSVENGEAPSSMSEIEEEQMSTAITIYWLDLYAWSFQPIEKVNPLHQKGLT